MAGTIHGRYVYPLLMAGLFFACGREKEYPMVREMVDGIQHITCPDYPRDGVVEYDMVEDLSIGDESDDNYILNIPFQLMVDSKGSIYVLDWGDERMQVYDSTGTWIRTIGRSGQGPGEFYTPAYFTISAVDSIYLNDARNKRINVYDGSGSFIRSLRYDGSYHSEIYVDGDGLIYIQESGEQDMETLSDVLQVIEESFTIGRLAMSNAKVFTYGPFRGDRKVMRRQGDGVISGGSPDGPNTLWAVCRDGRLIEGYNMDYRLNVIDEKGNALFNFGRPYDPVPNPYAGRGPHLETKPAFGRRILLEEKGNIWLKLYTKDPENENETVPVVYDVWSPDGIFIRQVTVPYTISAFHGGKAYCIRRTDEEVTVKRFVLREK
ncbi:6-bladed beta-propeller [bacterium]|nr:6-bladed beta-propeller [bacterium]